MKWTAGRGKIGTTSTGLSLVSLGGASKTTPMKFLSLLAVAVFLSAVSCERHSYEETKILHESHGGHDEHSEEAH
ncbi:MAG: hypothetical protein ACQKBU_08965 [Verrucomicrobiales bacterium]